MMLERRKAAMLAKAYEMAKKYHAGQVYKAGNDYMVHLTTVNKGCNNETVKVVAMLHDSIEDTNCTYKALENAGFSSEVINAIEAITKVDGEAYQDYLIRVKGNPIARQVKKNGKI